MAEDVDRAGDGTPADGTPAGGTPPQGGLLPEPVVRPETRPEPVSEPAHSTELGFPTGAQPPSTYAPRFRMITGALIGVAIGALAATALLLAGGGPGGTKGPAWSAWKPTKDSTTDGAEQIAKHVGGRYRLSSGDQLVLVTGGPLRVAGLDIPVRLATRETQGGASEVKGRSVMYQLCGLGARCAINKGKPSTERFLLLRREALELALYSFRYLGGVKNVVALLPPAPGKKPENAMLFRKGRYEGTLDRPLAATLPSPPPTLNALPDSPEAGLIQRLTDENLFRYSFQQGQDLSAFLILQALPGS
jgi:hypothetical protein